jgi:hypothetical protein
MGVADRTQELFEGSGVENNMKTDLTEIRYEAVDWIHVTLDRDP